MLITMLALLLPCLPQEDLELSPADDFLTVYPDDQVVLKTGHYELHLQGTASEAEGYGDLLEMAWKQYKELLKGAPKKAKTPVYVKLFEDHDKWIEGMEREQVIPPSSTDFMHYSSDRETIFLYRGRDEYWTCKMMLYGAFQQFHYRRKSKNENLAKSWFVHGIADALSTHLWDGQELLLNVNHTFEHNNRTRAALGRSVLKLFEDGELDLEDLQNIDLRWAMVAYLLKGDEGKHRKKFEKLALGSRGSMLLGRDYAKLLGGEKKLHAGLFEWLQRGSQIMLGTWGTWTETPGALHGLKPGDLVHALSLTERRAEYLEVRVQPGGESIGGVLLDWNGPEDYVVASLDGTLLRVEHVIKQKGKLLAEFLMPWPKDGTFLFQLERKSDEVKLTINGDEPGSYPVLGDQMGLFIEKGQIQYEDLNWR